MEMPKKEYLKCGDITDDLDGFGVLYCEKCGYCEHSSITGDVCDFCEKVIDEKITEKYYIKRNDG